MYAFDFFKNMLRNGKVLEHVMKYKRYDVIANFDASLLNKRDVSGDTLLHKAVRHNDYHTTKQLLKSKASRYQRNAFGDNAYDIAVAKKDYKMLWTLSKYKRNNGLDNSNTSINKRDVSGDTMLHKAVRHSDYYTTEKLLKNKACKYQRNAFGDDAYDIAVAKKDYKMLWILGKYKNKQE